jgi:Protein of unknown function (DUF3455)
MGGDNLIQKSLSRTGVPPIMKAFLRHPRITASKTTAALLFAVVAGGASANGSAADPVPDALRAPAGQVLAIAARGVGVQIYACTPAKDDPLHYTWTLKAPEAELRDKWGKPLGKHYGGPTWEAVDGSKVVGELVAKTEGSDATAIPWLLLRAKSTSGSGVFSGITSIQRLRTVGGKAPATGCDAEHAGTETRIPYSADYHFYKAG